MDWERPSGRPHGWASRMSSESATDGETHARELWWPARKCFAGPIVMANILGPEGCVPDVDEGKPPDRGGSDGT